MGTNAGAGHLYWIDHRSAVASRSLGRFVSPSWQNEKLKHQTSGFPKFGAGRRCIVLMLNRVLTVLYLGWSEYVDWPKRRIRSAKGKKQFKRSTSGSARAAHRARVVWECVMEVDGVKFWRKPKEFH